MQAAPRVSVPVLTYHSIDESGSVISTAPDVFRRQMKFLYENEWRAVSLKELVEDLIAHKTPPPKTVAVTFDDGFRNFFEAAYPVLEEYGFRATVFLVTDFCGKHNDWAGNPPELPRSRLLGWPEIKRLSERGIEFGAHTRSHKDLTKCPPGEMMREISESKKEIENRLGREAATFAYPFGSINAPVREAAAANFKAACSTNLGKVRAGSDLFALERLDTYYLSNPKVFEKLEKKSFDRYMQLRQILRDFKALVGRN